MIILQETSEQQELNIIARDNGTNLLTFTDEQTNGVTIIASVDFIDAGYYLSADIVLDFLKEDHTYRMRAYSTAIEQPVDTFNMSTEDSLNYLNGVSAEISFNSLVFVTNQDVVDNAGIYNVNDAQYKSNETTNEYIILD